MDEKGMLLEAEKAMAGRDFESARKILKKLLTSKPKGWRFLKEGKGKVEIAFWNQEDFLRHSVEVGAEGTEKRGIFWTGPPYTRMMFLMAMMDVEEGKYDDAMVWLDKALELEPDNPTLMGEKAFILKHKGNNEEAYGLYMEAVESRSWASPTEVASAMRGAGVALVDLQRLDEAEDLLRRSLELDPESVIARKELIYIEGLRGGGTAGETETQSPFDEQWYHREPERIEKIIEGMGKEGKPKKRPLLKIGPFTINEEDLMP